MPEPAKKRGRPPGSKNKPKVRVETIRRSERVALIGKKNYKNLAPYAANKRRRTKAFGKSFAADNIPTTSDQSSNPIEEHSEPDMGSVFSSNLFGTIEELSEADMDYVFLSYSSTPNAGSHHRRLFVTSTSWSPSHSRSPSRSITRSHHSTNEREILLSSDPYEALAELKQNINLSTCKNFSEFNRQIKNLKFNSPVITRWLFENLQNEKQRPSEDEYFNKYYEGAYRVYRSNRLLKVKEFKKLWNEVLSEKHTTKNAAKKFVCLSENPSCQYNTRNGLAMKNHLFKKHLGLTFECCCGQRLTYYASYTAHYSSRRCKYKDSVKKLQSQSSECNKENLDKIFVKYQNGGFRPNQSCRPITVEQFSKLWDEAQSDERVTKNGQNFVYSCENDACVTNRYKTLSLPKMRKHVLTHHFKLSYECICGKTFLSYGGYTGHYSTNRCNYEKCVNLKF